MNILIDIGYPAHVHLFKNLYFELSKNGYNIHFTTKDKECSIQLLKAYELPYTNFGKPYKGLLGKLYGLIAFNLKILKVAHLHKTDLFLSVSSMYAAQVSFLLRKPHVVLDDTEHSKFEHWLYKPFSTVLVNPSSFSKDFGKKQLKYDGFHELAYLHPDHFTPNKSVLKELNINKSKPIAFLRFVAWNAGHDIKQKGLSLNQKKLIIESLLKQEYKILISSEEDLPKEFKPYQIKIAPEKVHHVLAYSSIYIGEGATMASECAILGTPAIYINPLNAGTLKEQENYGLIYSFRNFEGVIKKISEVISNPNSKQECQEKKNIMLNENINLTSFLRDLIIKDVKQTFKPQYEQGQPVINQQNVVQQH